MLRHDNSEHTTHRITDRTSGASASSFGANHPFRDMARRGGQDDAKGSSSFLKKSGTGTVPGPAPAGAGKSGRNGPLGIYPKSVDSRYDAETAKSKENKRLTSRRQLYADLKTSAMILRDAMPDKLHAVAKCRWTKVAGFVTLNLVDVGGGQRRAAFKGVKICGNVWGCPVCASRISQGRRAEMNTLLAWGREKSLIPVMLTLTARHGLEDRLQDMLDAMKKAKRRLRQRAEWRRLPVIGTVTATEVTHGTRNGWHPHFHEIVLLEASDEAEALAMVTPLGDAWRASLRAYGLDGAEVAFDAQGAGSAGDYVAKWGVAEEITMTNAKNGKAGKQGRGRSPRELVRLAGAGDDDARNLWLEFFSATSGKRRRQLVWSPGLKSACGVDEATDEQIAEAEDARQEQELAEYDNEAWRRVRTKRVRLMDAGERGGSFAVRLAESGPDDTDPDPQTEVIDPDCDEAGQTDGNASGDDFDDFRHPGNLSASDVPKANTVRASSHMHAPDLLFPAGKASAGRPHGVASGRVGKVQKTAKCVFWSR